jgi:putative ABC transport system substrate-binding protein
MIRRREFITLLGGAAARGQWRRAQQPARPVVGFLRDSPAEGFGHFVAALRKGLSETGFVEGQNIAIEFGWSDGHTDRLPTLAANFVRRPVSVIVASAIGAALAAKAATSALPIVFAIGGDPVRTGLVDSLNRPGGNLTGAAHINVETAPKRLELLHELMSAKKVIGLLVNKTNPLVDSVVADVQAAAASLGLELKVVHARNDEDVDAAFSNLTQMRIGALVIGTDPFFTSRSEKLGAMSLRLAIPAIYQYRAFVEAGGLMSYGGSITDSYNLAGRYVGRILKGEKPADLPVMQPTKFEFVINLQTAKLLGLDRLTLLNDFGAVANAVSVLGPGALEPIMGREIAALVRAIHEEHGVVFHLETTARSIDEKEVTLANGTKLAGYRVEAAYLLPGATITCGFSVSGAIPRRTSTISSRISPWSTLVR